MSALLFRPPFDGRDDDALFAELDELTRFHEAGCPPYARIVAGRAPARSIAELPYLHVTLFKQVTLRTEGPGIAHGRTLLSSSTTGQSPSRIVLDDASARLQSESATAILRDFVGESARPLLVLADPRSLRRSADVAASTAAALGLRGLASDVHFVLEGEGAEARVRWDKVAAIAAANESVFVYGVSFVLWQRWAAAAPPSREAAVLARTNVTFVHSGGWKKLEHRAIARADFDAALLRSAGPGSRVVDYYGLVEQNGIVFPLCEAGVRHVPRWAHVMVRDVTTLEPTSERGLLQIANPLARGAPYHIVLTEDLGRIVAASTCACGRSAPAFELLGRLPRAETRGCSDVGAGSETRDGQPADVAAVAASPSLAPVAPRTFARPWTVGPRRTLLLAHDLDALFESYATLQRAMARAPLADFTRDEWAFLVRFVDPRALRDMVLHTFAGPAEGPHLFFRPASPIAAWLPSTTTSMGALFAVLASTTGASVRLKVSTKRDDPTASFVRFVTHAVAGSEVARYFDEHVTIVRASRDESPSQHLGRDARLRVVFGASNTARHVEGLPHPITSRFVAFAHRTSEAWLSKTAARDANVQSTLSRVFGVYGQDACTAPRRVVIVGGDASDAEELARALAASPPVAPPHAADALLAEQWGRAGGFSAHVTPARDLVALQGPLDLPMVGARPALHVSWGTRDAALAALATDIQTVGLDDALLGDTALVRALAAAGAARVVPLTKMHFFGETWDGIELLRAMFETTSVLEP